MFTTENADEKLVKTLNRLVDLSVKDTYEPYSSFDWPEKLPDDQPWMSFDLLSVYDTPFMEQLTETQLIQLTRWESINFYSRNVHEIRELMIEITKRIYMPGFAMQSEYLHHILGEENEHMWMFAQFCLRYGNKIYDLKKVKYDTETEADIQNFIAFALTLIFEEFIDYFNTRMGRDESLHPIIREVNNVHHQQESRHIAFGRQIVKMLHEPLVERYSPERLAKLENYLRGYIDMNMKLLYSPAVYRDAGIADPYKFRRQVMEWPTRPSHHERFSKRTIKFFEQSGIFATKGGSLNDGEYD